jgi:hypothetical protein
LLALALPLVLTGCLWSSGGTTGYGSGSDSAGAEANVRAAIPAIEAYYADHATYRRATLRALQQYDAAVADVRIVSATRGSYCIESTVGGSTYHKRGPGAEIVPGSCPR